MRILDYATPRGLRSDVGKLLLRLALFVGVSVAAYFLIWFVVMYIVGRLFRIPI